MSGRGDAITWFLKFMQVEKLNWSVPDPITVEWRQPVIRFNSKVVQSSELVVKPGASLELRCEGDGPVNWQTRLPKHKRYMSRSPGKVRTIRVERPTAEFTGTYKCFYSAWPQHRHLTSSVHVYVKGEFQMCFAFTCSPSMPSSHGPPSFFNFSVSVA